MKYARVDDEYHWNILNEFDSSYIFLILLTQTCALLKTIPVSKNLE